MPKLFNGSFNDCSLFLFELELFLHFISIEFFYTAKERLSLQNITFFIECFIPSFELRANVEPIFEQKKAFEKAHQLKLEIYSIYRKMKNVIGRIFISIIMHPIFMRFRLKISLKSALGKFCFSQWAFENSLNLIIVGKSLFSHIFSLLDTLKLQGT